MWDKNDLYTLADISKSFASTIKKKKKIKPKHP